MGNAWLDESQAVIKIARGNINNLRYGDNTILIAESEEEIRGFFEEGKGECKNWLNTQHSKN